MSQRYIWLILGLLLSFSAPAQVQFHTRVEAKKVLAGSPFNITFELNNASGSGFTPPDFGKLQVLSGPARMNTVNIVNGRRSSSSSYTYEIVGYKPGKYRIGKAKIYADGHLLTTKPIMIEVLKASQKAKIKEEENPILIQMEIDSGNYYIGQQIILSIKLLTRTNVLDYNIDFNPNFTDAYIRELNVQLHKKREIVNGKEYASYILKRYAFYPQRAGKFDLPAAAVTIGVEDPNAPSRRRSFFFDPPMKRYRMVTSPVEIKVKDLPQGAPASFAGAVGHYTAKFYANHKRLTTDDAIKLSMQITGDGDDKINEAPEMDFGNAFDVYDPVLKNERPLRSEERIRFQKHYEYAVIPKEPGEYSIVPEFSYFNPDSQAYQSIYSDTIRLHVARGLNGRSNQLTEETGRFDLHDIHYQPVLSKGSFYLFVNPVYWALFAGLLGWIAWLYFRYWQRKKIEAIDPATRRRQIALQKAKEYLKEALDTKDKNSAAYYKAIQNGILSYLRNKLGIRTSQLNKSNIRQMLQQHHISGNLIDETIAIISDCDTALYAPNLFQEGEKTLFNRASDLIAGFEGALER